MPSRDIFKALFEIVQLVHIDRMRCHTERWEIDFDVAKSIRYHAYRRSFLDGWSNLTKILTVISGTAVLVTLVGEYSLASTILAVGVAVTSAMDLVLRFSEKARIHDGLYRAFSRLAQEIAAIEEPTPETIAAWRRRRLEIEMDEPTAIGLLERRCAGEEAKARGSDIRPSWKLSPAQILLSQFSFWPASLK